MMPNKNNDDNIHEEDLASASQRLTIRPYFQSQNTGQRVWDEPPSGASEIIYATSEARRMAQAQLEEMRTTYANAAVRRRLEREEKKELKKKEEKLVRQQQQSSRLSRLFKKSFSENNTTTTMTTAAASGNGENDQDDALLLRYSEESNTSCSNNNKNNCSRKLKRKPRGVLVLTDEDSSNGIPKSILKESKEMARSERRSKYEEELQMAMMLSMNMGGGSVMGVGDALTSSRDNIPTRKGMSKSLPPQPQLSSPSTNNEMTSMSVEEQEQLAMALSLSEQQAAQDNIIIKSRGGAGGCGYSNIRRKSSKKNAEYYTSITDSLLVPNYIKGDDDDDGGGKMPPRERYDV